MAAENLSFLELLQTFRRGELIEDGNDALQELFGAIQLTGGKGSLTITLPFAMNKAGQIECTPSINIKKPRKPSGTGLYFLTDDASLSQRDPKQNDWVDDLERRRNPGN